MRSTKAVRLAAPAIALIGIAVFIHASDIRGADTNPATQPAALILPAVLVPDEQVELYAKASGYVSEITVDIGSKVKRGDVLIQLDIPELLDDLRQAEAALNAKNARLLALQAKAKQAALLVESAKAEQERFNAALDLAEITLKRKTELHQQKAIPDQEFDVAKNVSDLARAEVAVGRAKTAAAEGELASAKAEVKSGEADVAMAQADLNRVKTLIGYMSIKAPFDGVIVQRNTDHGTFVRSAAQSAGAPLLTIAKVDVVRVVIDLPEAGATRVQAGTPAMIEFRASGVAARAARITRTAGSIRQDTRTMRTEIDLDNRDGLLLPGMYARVQLGGST